MLGWATQSTVLGAKQDECPSCGFTVEHDLVRRTTWFFFFWVIPILPLRIRRGVACTHCHAWTGVGWRAMRRALKSGRLPMDRPRPQFAATLGQPDPTTGQVRDAGEYFDPVAVNPRRGRWDIYLKAWPLLALAAVLAVGVGIPALREQTVGDAADLRTGDCFEVPTGSADVEVESVQHRPCNTAHDGEVYAVVAMPAGTYPTADAVDEFVSRECAGTRFEAFMGKPFEEAFSVTIGYFYPTTDGWKRGDRNVTCYATPEGGITVNHSYKAQP